MYYTSKYQVRSTSYRVLLCNLCYNRVQQFTSYSYEYLLRVYSYLRCSFGPVRSTPDKAILFFHPSVRLFSLVSSETTGRVCLRLRACVVSPFAVTEEHYHTLLLLLHSCVCVCVCYVCVCRHNTTAVRSWLVLTRCCCLTTSI